MPKVADLGVVAALWTVLDWEREKICVKIHEILIFFLTYFVDFSPGSCTGMAGTNSFATMASDL